MPQVPRAPKSSPGMVKKGVVPKMAKPSPRPRAKTARLLDKPLSILKYEPEWEDVYQNMFNREADIDRHSNEFYGDK